MNKHNPKTENEVINELLKLLEDDNIPDCPNFSDEERSALEEEIPMSAELYISCIEKCLEVDDTLQYISIIEQFPEHQPVLDAYFEKKHGLKPTTPEDAEASLKKFKERLFKERGIDLLSTD